jgi:hypothetical protein
MEEKRLAKGYVLAMLEICGVNSQDEFAKNILGIKPQSVSGAIARGKIPGQWIELVCKKYSVRPSDIAKRAYEIAENDAVRSELRISSASYREEQSLPQSATEPEQTRTYATQDFRRTCIGMLEPIIEYIAESYGTRPSDIERFKADFVERMPEYQLWLYGEVGKKRAGGCDKDGPSK